AVTSAEAVVGLQPFEDGRRLGGLVEALSTGEFDELARGESGLGLDGVEVGLKGHDSPGFGQSMKVWMISADAWMQRMRNVPSPMLVKPCTTRGGTVAVSPASAIRMSSPRRIRTVPSSTTHVSE